MVSLNDVCVLDSLFEEKRQERKQQLTTDKTLTETIQWIGDDTNERQTDDISEQSEDSSDTNKVEVETDLNKPGDCGTNNNSPSEE